LQLRLEIDLNDKILFEYLVIWNSVSELCLVRELLLDFKAKEAIIGFFKGETKRVEAKPIFWLSRYVVERVIIFSEVYQQRS
jgi:hypothetical protein